MKITIQTADKLKLMFKRYKNIQAALGSELGSGKISRDEYFKKIEDDRRFWKRYVFETIDKEHI